MLGMPLAGTQPLGLSSSAGKPKAMAGGVFFFDYFGAKVATQERALGGHAPCGHG